jgi:hypothetical protein
MPQKTRKYHTVLTSQAAVARMDPISSLSIAAAVVQFLDFGSKLVGRGLQALKSVWSEKAMNDVERRLATFRNEIEFHILVDLRYATLVCI